MKEIFIVMANTAYEGSDPVQAFACREDADALVQKCREHEGKKPRFPVLDAPDGDWLHWRAADLAWEIAHPATPYVCRESYSVLPLRFVSERG